jgi:uncharacterized protein
MSDPVLSFSARDHGLPTRAELVAYRLWDMHYHGIDPPYIKSPVEQNEIMFRYVDRMGVEVVCPFLHVGIGTIAGLKQSLELDRQLEQVFERWRNRLAGFLWINSTDVSASLKAIDQWVAKGPMVGFKFGNRGVPCSHPNYIPLIERAAELKAPVYIHAWYIVGGEPRRYDGGVPAVASSPRDVAILAERFPNVPLICGHAGGDWELGVRTIRPYKNVTLEFSGSDPNSGCADFAVRELGAERVVWGGHIPSRCYSNELSKIFDADISETQRQLILGGNLRRLLAPIFKTKGVDIKV